MSNPVHFIKRLLNVLYVFTSALNSPVIETAKSLRKTTRPKSVDRETFINESVILVRRIVMRVCQHSDFSERTQIDIKNQLPLDDKWKNLIYNLIQSSYFYTIFMHWILKYWRLECRVRRFIELTYRID